MDGALLQSNMVPLKTPIQANSEVPAFQVHLDDLCLF